MNSKRTKSKDEHLATNAPRDRATSGGRRLTLQSVVGFHSMGTHVTVITSQDAFFSFGSTSMYVAWGAATIIIRSRMRIPRTIAVRPLVGHVGRGGSINIIIIVNISSRRSSSKILW